MKMSPLDIYNHEFSKTTFGYNTKQVDEFLDDVGVAYEKLLKEVNKLSDENEKIKEKMSNQEDIEEKLQNIILTVQETAREMTSQAQKEADIIIKKAEIKAEKIEDEAKDRIKEEYKKLQEIKESKDLFKIRFKTLLKSHLDMLEKDNIEEQKTTEAHIYDTEDEEE